MYIHSDHYVPMKEVHIVVNPLEAEYLQDFLSQYFQVRRMVGILYGNSTEYVSIKSLDDSIDE